MLLDQLRAWVSWPKRPISFERLDELAKENPRVGPGVLSRSTMHRALREKKLSSLQQDPVVFVEAFVVVLGVDPDPWVRHVWFRACLTYLPEPPAPRAPVTECTGRY